MSAGSPTPEEKVDHLARAQRHLGHLGEHKSVEQYAAECLAAQAHAQLAIAEELRGIREALEVGNLTYVDGMVRDA